MTEQIGPGPHPTQQDSEALAAQFDASFKDPTGYANSNFTGQAPTREQQYEASRQVQQEQQAVRKGRHRK